MKPPAHNSQTKREFRDLQKLMAAAVMRPLARGDKMQVKWIDGAPTKIVVNQFIKPNDRLTSFERLEIYNRQYWFRIRDCFYQDYPGLRAILGEKNSSGSPTPTSLKILRVHLRCEISARGS